MVDPGTIWHKISTLGIEASLSGRQKRNLALANQINFIMAVLLGLVSLAAWGIREYYDNPFTIHTQKLLVLLLLCFINIFLSSKKQINLVRFNLIAFPSLIIVFIPIFLGEIQNFDVLVAPFLVLALSIIPLIILNPDFRSPVYNMSLLYFVLQAALVYRAMDYFSGGALLVM